MSVASRAIVWWVIGLLTVVGAAQSVSAENGVTETEIRLATVLDLEGRSQGLGQNMLKGMQAALQNETVSGRKLVLLSRNDSYTPDKTVVATRELMDESVFLFMGNVGTPTASVSLPILTEAGIPALGYFTGSGILRSDNELIVNYRASYRQETEAVIRKALTSGVKPTEVCAYVQNDAYGMSGIQGVSAALEGEDGVEEVQKTLEAILAQEGENPVRNGMGPVGVYVRNTFRAREGYDSLKAWEKKSGTQCKLVVTVGSYDSVAHFVAYADSKGEPWTYSAVSFTGAENLYQALARFNVSDRVVMTQVVPAIDSSLAIVSDARLALRDDLNLVSLEGYIVGRLLLHGLKTVEEQGLQLNRESFLNVFSAKQFNLGGLNMDFSRDNQGSDFVAITKLDKNRWVPMDESTWRGWYNE